MKITEAAAQQRLPFLVADKEIAIAEKNATGAHMRSFVLAGSCRKYPTSSGPVLSGSLQVLTA
jgi:hypothetical protein